MLIAAGQWLAQHLGYADTYLSKDRLNPPNTPAQSKWAGHRPQTRISHRSAPAPFHVLFFPLECPPLLFSRPTRSSWVILGAPGLRTLWGLNDKISRVTLLRAWCTVGPRGMSSSLNEPANADCRVWGFGRTFWRLPEAHHLPYCKEPPQLVTLCLRSHGRSFRGELSPQFMVHN